MNDEEIDEQELQRNIQSVGGEQHIVEELYPGGSLNLNLNVGFLRTFFDPPLEDGLHFGLQFRLQSKAQPSKPSADLFRLWAKFFSPAGKPDTVVQIPQDWAPFFLKSLLSPATFDWAKSFLLSSPWKAMIETYSGSDHLQFALPPTCPDSVEVMCDSQTDPGLDGSPPDDKGKSSSTQINPLVETAFRRSPRIKEKNGGFKHSSCAAKGCLACSSVPPAVSLKMIKSVGEKVRLIPSDKLSDKALKSKPKSFKAIGDKSTTSKGTKNKKLKKRAQDKQKSEDDVDSDEDLLE
jgi:hypothetical protein